jgi:hypothetical protein
MALPTQVKTWNFTLNQRISYVSLNDASASLMFGIKAMLKSAGYTVKGSCDGTTGAMDGTDRWTTKANCTTRGTTTSAALSWMCLTDGNGANIVIGFLGATDDIFEISFSPSGSYVAASTPAWYPVATSTADACTAISTVTIVGSTTSGDRVWSGMVSSDLKMFRIIVFRAGVALCAFGVDLCVPAAFGPSVTFSPAMVGWAYTSTHLGSNMFGTPSAGVQGQAKPLLASVLQTATVNVSMETPWLNDAILQTTSAELQGSLGPFIMALGWYSNSTSARGKLGNQIDKYMSFDSQVDGTLSTDKKWIFLSGSGTAASPGTLLPWDGSTAVVST